MFKLKASHLTTVAAFAATAATSTNMQLHPALVLSTACGIAYLALLACNSVTLASPRKTKRKVSA